MNTRLAQYSLHAYRLPYARAVKWSDTVEEAATFLLLKLESASGQVGVAEMTIKPTWMGHSVGSLVAALEEVLLPRLAGCDLLDEAAVQRQLDMIPEQHAGKTLVDNALWDLRAAAGGQPLWQRWGGRDRVQVSVTITRQAPALMAAEARQWVGEHGLRILKIKGGQGLEADLQALRLLRKAVGDDVRFYVDANGFYPMSEAAAYAAAMHDAGALVVEDPCNFAPDPQFSALQRAVPCPLLVDFPCTSWRDAELFLLAGARAFSLKPGRFGLSMTSGLLEMAQRAGALTVVGMFGESALGSWQALALAARQAPAGSLPAEVTWYLAMREQVVTRIPAIRDGEVELQPEPSVAGLVDWDRLRRLSFLERSATLCPASNKETTP